MIVFRLARKKYKIELSGVGAALSSNRWNSKGVEMIYCSDSRALALAEVAVHMSLSTMPDDYVLIEIEIPNNLKILEIKVNDLPAYWNGFPHQISTQTIGDKFIRSQESAVLKVPSAVVPGDSNYLINTSHKSFSRIRIKKGIPFSIDNRLF